MSGRGAVTPPCQHSNLFLAHDNRLTPRPKIRAKLHTHTRTYANLRGIEHLAPHVDVAGDRIKLAHDGHEQRRFPWSWTQDPGVRENGEGESTGEGERVGVGLSQEEEDEEDEEDEDEEDEEEEEDEEDEERILRDRHGGKCSTTAPNRHQRVHNHN